MCLLCDIRNNRVRTEPNFVSLLMAAMAEAEQQEQNQPETDAFAPGTKYRFNMVMPEYANNENYPKDGQEVIVLSHDLVHNNPDCVFIGWQTPYKTSKSAVFHKSWLLPIAPLRERAIDQITEVLANSDSKREAATVLFDVIMSEGIDGLGKRNE